MWNRCPGFRVTAHARVIYDTCAGNVIYANDVINGAPSSMCVVPCMRCRKHGVIPGRRAAASPESIATSLSSQTNAGEYGFRAPAFGRPRNDRLRSVESDVTYARNVIYASDVMYEASLTSPDSAAVKPD